MEDKSWYNVVLENWSQIVVLLGMISYLIQILINWNLKKNEISFSKIQENKIQEVMSFYKSYQALRIALESFLNQTMFGEHSDEKLNEIRVHIQKCYFDFELNCMTVKLFIEKSDINTINEINEIFESIKVDIELWHIYRDSQSPPDDWNKLKEIREERLKIKLPELVKSIESNLRKNYNIS